MLEVRNLSAAYGHIQAISSVSLNVGQGQVIALLGANGAGKSTTLKCLSGLLKPKSGEILFEGEAITGQPSHKIVARGISLVPEGRETFPDMSVRDNIELGAYLRNDRAQIASDIERVTDYFPILRKRFGQKAGTLSGGEQQMLMMARSLMSRPKLLLLDEPSLGLSPLLVEQIFEIVQRMAADGMTLLIVEQNSELALDVCSFAYVLENGEIVAQGASQDLRRDNRLREAYLGL